MIEMAKQNSPERAFLNTLGFQYVVCLMKHRDSVSVRNMEFNKHNRGGRMIYVPHVKQVRRRPKNGVQQMMEFTPNYPAPVEHRIRTLPISASETERRIYSGNLTDEHLRNQCFWTLLKKANGTKDFQLFWCIEDYTNQDFKVLDAHAALFIRGLHTDSMNKKYSTDQRLKEKYNEDYGVRDIIAECVREAGLSVKHKYEHGRHRGRLHSQIIALPSSCKTHDHDETAEHVRKYYHTKSINDASGTGCSGFNKKFEKKFQQFLRGLTND